MIEWVRLIGVSIAALVIAGTALLATQSLIVFAAALLIGGRAIAEEDHTYQRGRAGR